MLFFIFLFSLIQFAFAEVSYVPKSLPLHDSGNEFNIRFDYFQSLKNIDSNGNLIEFSDGEQYFRADLVLSYAYGFTDDFQLKLGAITRSNSSSQRIEDELETFSNSGLKSTFVNLLYRLPKQENMEYTLEFEYEAASFTNDVYEGGDRDSIILGDDGSSVSIGLNVTYYTQSQNFLTARALYRNPSENLSNEIFTQVEGVLVFNRVSMLAGVEYLYSLDQDAYTNEPDEKPQYQTGNTSLYNSINRAWFAPYLGFNFAFNDKWRLEFLTKPRLSGNSTDVGNNYLITLARRNSKSNNYELKYSTFKEYTIEASVIKVSKSRESVIVDAGQIQGLDKGNKVDFFFFDYVDGNKLIGSGYVVKAGANKSMVKVTKRFDKKRIEVGTIMRGGLLKN
tara:strand:- start:24876 stop:26057 length:1182 start_codon:yes stop_codon:yes gene_type:complete